MSLLVAWERNCGRDTWIPSNCCKFQPTVTSDKTLQEIDTVFLLDTFLSFVLSISYVLTRNVTSDGTYLLSLFLLEPSLVATEGNSLT